MPLLSAVDLRAAIAALGGVDITIGSTTIVGLVRKPDVQLFESGEIELIGRSVLALVCSEDLTGLAITVGGAITVAGEARKVHRYMAESDGSVTRILCTLA